MLLRAGAVHLQDGASGGRSSKDTGPMTAFHAFPSSGDKRRGTRCSLCAAENAAVVGRMNYAGLGEWDVVQCPHCGLISFDPMPDVEVIEEGGKRLYLVQQSSHSRRRFLHFFSRSYRRGGHFALHYLRKFELLGEDAALLEVGAGNGYFSQGIKKIYPLARVHYLDVMEDLLPYYEKHFECEAVAGEFSGASFQGRTFDLIVARDILEHVRDPLQFLRDAHALLKPGGAIFFITPNGRENFWECNQRFRHAGAATLTWQNHFHYYLPETLRRMLAAAGFREEVAFKWGLKHWRLGQGHEEMPWLAAEEVPELAGREPEQRPSEKWAHDSAEVTRGWLHNLGPLSRAYSAMADRQKEQVDFGAAQGWEFFVIARKIESGSSGA